MGAYIGAQRVRLYARSELTVLPLEQDTKAIEKRLIKEEYIITPSEEFSSNASTGPDLLDFSRKELALATREISRDERIEEQTSGDSAAVGEYQDEEVRDALKARLAHLH